MTVLAANEHRQEQRTVRVGYVNVATYEEGGEGEYKQGSGYEYLQKISYYTGWKYEYVYGSFKDCYNMLVNGDIDLLGNVSYKPERAELFNFSTYPQGKDTYLLYTTKEHTELTGGDIHKLNGYVIGVTDGSYQQSLLMEWLKNNHIQAVVEKYNGYDSLMKALDSGKLQVIATPDLATSYDYLPITNFGYSDYYFAVSKKRTDLLNELNEALYEIQNSELDYNNQLASRYHNKMSNGLLLSKKERAWLKEHKNVIRLGYLKDNLPYSGQSQNGELIGIISTVVNTLEKEFNVTVNVSCFDTMEALARALKDGDVDISGPVYSDFYLAEQQNYALTNAMISTTPVLIYKGNKTDNSLDTIAVSNSSIFTKEVIGVLFPKAKVISFANVEECLNAVVSGKAGSTLGASSQLNILLSYPDTDRLQFSEIAKKTEVCLASTKENCAVATIFSKGISLSSDILSGTVLMQNSYVEHQMTVKEFIKKHLFMVSIVAIVTVLILSFFLYRTQCSKKQLAAALKEAQEANVANAAKSAFLHNMSHDIRTPMNAILGYNSLMKKDLTDPKLISYQEKIEQSGNMLLSIINNVLDMARIESGKTDVDESYNEAGSIVRELCDIFEVEARKKHISLSCETNVKHKNILCDVTKVKEIFANLISNAVKYTPEGGHVTIKTQEISCEKKGYARFRTEVVDNGIGMSKEYLPTLFDSFTREQDTTTNKISGTGLGMAIVKKLVNLMHGTITVESEQGKGTKFVIILEHPIAAEAYYKTKESNYSEAINEYNIQGKHILLAEDNELNAEIATAVLGGMGLIVDRVEDGIQCIAKLQQMPAGSYDLILMDIQMPNMDGYNATQNIRKFKDKEKANIPIIAMTANAFEEDKKRAIAQGMNGHIAKPIDAGKIKEVLSSVLERSA